jgi:hypothetical protein
MLYGARKTSKDKSNNPVADWQYLVAEYSALKFTRRSDLLPALAGIVQYHAQFRKDDQYVAGMWKNSLVEDLGFCSRDGSVSDPDAPSWSWTCLRGPILFNHIQRSPTIEVTQLNFDRTSPVNVGQVKNASIKLRGSVISIATWRVRKGDEVCVYIPHPNAEKEVCVQPVNGLKFLELDSGSTMKIVVLSRIKKSGRVVGLFLVEVSPGRFKRVDTVGIYVPLDCSIDDDVPQALRLCTELMENYVLSLPVQEVEII